MPSLRSVALVLLALQCSHAVRMGNKRQAVNKTVFGEEMQGNHCCDCKKFTKSYIVGGSDYCPGGLCCANNGIQKERAACNEFTDVASCASGNGGSCSWGCEPYRSLDNGGCSHCFGVGAVIPIINFAPGGCSPGDNRLCMSNGKKCSKYSGVYEQADCHWKALQHEGENCWQPCGGNGVAGGYCSWCGQGNACCKDGHGSDPPECARAIEKPTNHHQCVRLMPITTTTTTTSTTITTTSTSTTTTTTTTSTTTTTTACTDTDNGSTDTAGDTCAYYHTDSSGCGHYDHNKFKARTMCCACGGGHRK